VGRYSNPGRGTPVVWATFPAGNGLTEQGLRCDFLVGSLLGLKMMEHCDSWSNVLRKLSEYIISSVVKLEMLILRRKQIPDCKLKIEWPVAWRGRHENAWSRWRDGNGELSGEPGHERRSRLFSILWIGVACSSLFFNLKFSPMYELCTI
jgi:hypothetical protein